MVKKILNVYGYVKNTRLQTKLFTSFFLVAAITLLAGSVGWIVAGKLKSHLYEVGRVRLPGVYYTMKINDIVQEMRIAQFVLLDPDVSPGERSEQYTQIKHLRKRYQKTLSDYKPLLVTTEGKNLFADLTNALDQWERENSRFLELSCKLDTMDIANPVVLKKNIEQFRGDLYKLKSEVWYYIQTNSGLEDPGSAVQSSFGRWVDTFSSKNKKLQTLVNDIVPLHKKFYEAVHTIHKQVTLGRIQDATLSYFQDMVPAAEKMFVMFEQLRAMATKTESLYNAMNTQAKVRCFEKQQGVLALVNKIIDYNNKQADGAVASSMQSAHWAKINSTVGCVLGSAASLVFGILLTLYSTSILQKVNSSLTSDSHDLLVLSQDMDNRSTQLAGAAQEQTERLQTVSISLEEIAEAARENAQSCDEMSTLAQQAWHAAGRGNSEMEKMMMAINSIKLSADETATVVQNINSIAFHTKLPSTISRGV